MTPQKSDFLLNWWPSKVRNMQSESYSIAVNSSPLLLQWTLTAHPLIQTCCLLLILKKNYWPQPLMNLMIAFFWLRMMKIGLLLNESIKSGGLKLPSWARKSVSTLFRR